MREQLQPRSAKGTARRRARSIPGDDRRSAPLPSGRRVRPRVAGRGVGAPLYGGDGHGTADHRNWLERKPRVHDGRQLLPRRLQARRRLRDDPWLRGQRWAQPSVSDLRRAMRSVYENRIEAAATGMRARADVLVSCRPELVAEAVRERIEAIARHPSGAFAVEQGPSRQRATPAAPDPGHASARASWCTATPPCLTECLSSLHHLTDAITVVEAESDEDMASVRNDALDRATGDWVLMLDATQTLDPASVKRVRRLVEKDRFVGYAARELHQFGLDGAFSSVERRSVVLFPRHPDLRYAGRVDEQLLPQRPDLQFRLARSRVVLHQHDYREDRDDPVARARRHLPLLERSVREAPNEPFHLYNLGVALTHLGLNGEAEATVRRGIDLAPQDAIWAPSAYLAALARARAPGTHGRGPCALPRPRPSWRLTGRTGGACWARRWSTPASWRRRFAPTNARWSAATRNGCRRTPLMSRRRRSAPGWERSICCASNTRKPPSASPGPSRLTPRTRSCTCSSPAPTRRCDGRQTPGVTSIALPRSRAGDPLGLPRWATSSRRKAEDALLRGLAENAESQLLRERIERLRTARATA